MQWSDVLADPSLKNLPYKIELDELGRIVMTPASVLHGKIQARLSHLIFMLFNEGEVVTECPVATHAGVKVADVAWMSSDFSRRHGVTTPLPQAPELCIEVWSPSNSQREIQGKIHLYLGYGAREVWTVSDNGEITLFGPEGERTESCFPGVGRPVLPGTRLS